MTPQLDKTLSSLKEILPSTTFFPQNTFFPHNTLFPHSLELTPLGQRNQSPHKRAQYRSWGSLKMNLLELTPFEPLGHVPS